MDGLCVDTVDDDCVIWMINDGCCKRIPRIRLPFVTNMGIWLKIGRDNTELVEKDVRVSVDRGRLLVKDWFILTRNGAFSRNIGVAILEENVEYVGDRVFYLECEWDPHRETMVIHDFSPIEQKSDDCQEYDAAVKAFDASCRDSFWLTGIVCGSNGSSVFVATSSGLAVVFEHIVSKCQFPLRVGLYCRAFAEKMDTDKNCRLRINEVVQVDPPRDHGPLIVKNNHFEVTCTGSLTEIVGGASSPSHWIFYEPFLGNITLMNSDRPRNMFFSLGDRVRMVVIQKPKHLESSYTIWMVSSIVDRVDDPPIFQSTKHVLYFGLIMKIAPDGYGYVFCNEFARDVNIMRKENDSLGSSPVGKWIEFRLVRGGMIQHPIRIVPDIYPTRMISSIPEVRVQCQYKGIRDKGRAILESRLGSIRDEDGIIKEHGTHELWIVRYYRPGHTTRWKISYSERDARHQKKEITWEERHQEEKKNGESSRMRKMSHSPDERQSASRQQTGHEMENEECSQVDSHPDDDPVGDPRSLSTPLDASPSPIPPDISSSHLGAALRKVIFFDSVGDAITNYDEQLFNEIVDVLYPPDYYEKVSKTKTSERR